MKVDTALTEEENASVVTVMATEKGRGAVMIDEEETATVETTTTAILPGTMTTNVTTGAEGKTMTAVVEGMRMAETEVADGKEAVAMARLTGAPLLRRVVSPCRNESERPLGGTSTLRDTSNIQLSRQSRQDCSTCLEPTEPRCHPSWALPVSLPQFLSPPSEWVLASILTYLASLVGSILAASLPT